MRQRSFTLVIILLFIVFLGAIGYFAYTKGYFNHIFNKTTPSIISEPILTPSPSSLNTTNFSNSVTKIENDFKDIPHSTSSTYKGFVYGSKMEVIKVDFIAINFSKDYINDTTFQKRIDSYFSSKNRVEGYLEDVRLLYDIKCLLDKGGKDMYNPENLTTLSINCF